MCVKADEIQVTKAKGTEQGTVVLTVVMPSPLLASELSSQIRNGDLEDLGGIPVRSVTLPGQIVFMDFNSTTVAGAVLLHVNGKCLLLVALMTILLAWP